MSCPHCGKTNYDQPGWCLYPITFSPGVGDWICNYTPKTGWHNANPQQDTHMLVLTRNIDEQLIINDNIKVKVLGITGNQVRLGIEAPKNIEVHREEIYKKILQERAENPVVPAFLQVQAE